jgi:opacity protein-like surface antigen
MKKTFWIVTAVSFAAATAHADFVKGSQTMAIFGGLGGSSDNYDFRGPDNEPITGGGAAWGAQYLYYLTSSPAIAIGGDLNVSYNGNLRTDDLIANADATTRLKSTTELIMARLAYPRGRARPYIFTGLGAHESSLFVSAQPVPGTTWLDGSSGSRMIIDEHETSLAIAYGIGIDFFLTESLFFGTELRGTGLAGTKPDITPSGQALGFSLKDRTGASEGNIFFRLGWKFGA